LKGHWGRHAVSNTQPSPEINAQVSWRKLIWTPIAKIRNKCLKRPSMQCGARNPTEWTWKPAQLETGRESAKSFKKAFRTELFTSRILSLSRNLHPVMITAL